MGAATAAQHAAIGQHHGEPQHIGAGHAVFQAAGTACIGGNVAANAGFLAGGGVGRVEPAHLGAGGLQISREHAGLGHSHAIAGVHLQNAGHARHGNNDTALHGHAAAHIAHTCATRGHRNAPLVRKTQGCRHLPGRGSQHHSLWQRLGVPFVPCVGLQRGFIGAHAVAQQVFQLLNPLNSH